MKVLITGGKSALTSKIAKAFSRYHVQLADYGDVPLFSKFISLGEKNEDTIAHTLLNACLDQGVELILPIHKFEIEATAKAKVLFSEFNIDVLLPDDDLATYFDSKREVKFENWAVFIKGDPLFMSLSDEQLVAFGKKKHLNGVFYFNHEHAVANLALITI